MKILITGGSGFIGSHLTEELLRRNNKIVILDNLSTGSVKNIEHLRGNPNLELIVGSPLDIELLDKAMKGCEFVFHLAAAVGVKLVISNPTAVLSNIRISENVLETAYKYQAKVLITSSSEIYGKNTNGPLKEDGDRILGSTLKSRWSYSTAKAVDEILAYTFYKQKGLPTIIVRLFNVAGPRQTGSYGMVIPRFVEQALKGEDLTIYGLGSQTRCFTHVKDTILALIRLSEEPKAFGDVFNIGSQEEVSIEELAKRVIKIAKSNSRVVYIPYSEAYEEGFEDMLRRVPDITKIKDLIGFKVTYSLDEIIEDILDCIKKKS